MKALLLKQYKQLEVTDCPTPEIGPDEVLVRVRACGICGSDVHGFDGGSGRRQPPLIMGHEASGEVAAVGSNVKRFKDGDRVTFDSTVYCGQCWFCRRGQINLCDNRNVLGVSTGEYRRHGAFAEYVAVPQHIIYPLPDNLSFEEAALIESVSIAFHAVNRSPVRIGDTAVVVGTGMIGSLVIQTLRNAGCARIIAVDIDDYKLERAKEWGADEGINSKNVDAPAEIAARTEGRGADLAFEVVGATAPLNTAIASVRKGGSVTLVGNLTQKAELPLQAVVTREITLLGSCSSAGEYPACIALMARGDINVKPLISVTAPLEKGPEWFDRLYNHEAGIMKVILQP
ncbi:MAG: Alcohol dehydrogenase GroES domain protein [Armatimonadetes bacterium]|jgi:L-iditol 2-dehydrogenase|nr:Alcohol dehydrogenase GroES domain protein [Armatimonadota bacterium]